MKPIPGPSLLSRFYWRCADDRTFKVGLVCTIVLLVLVGLFYFYVKLKELQNPICDELGDFTWGDAAMIMTATPAKIVLAWKFFAEVFSDAPKPVQSPRINRDPERNNQPPNEIPYTFPDLDPPSPPPAAKTKPTALPPAKPKTNFTPPHPAGPPQQFTLSTTFDHVTRCISEQIGFEGAPTPLSSPALYRIPPKGKSSLPPSGIMTTKGDGSCLLRATAYDRTSLQLNRALTQDEVNAMNLSSKEITKIRKSIATYHQEMWRLHRPLCEEVNKKGNIEVSDYNKIFENADILWIQKLRESVSTFYLEDYNRIKDRARGIFEDILKLKNQQYTQQDLDVINEMPVPVNDWLPFLRPMARDLDDPGINKRIASLEKDISERPIALSFNPNLFAYPNANFPLEAIDSYLTEMQFPKEEQAKKGKVVVYMDTLGMLALQRRCDLTFVIFSNTRDEATPVDPASWPLVQAPEQLNPSIQSIPLHKVVFLAHNVTLDHYEAMDRQAALIYLKATNTCRDGHVPPDSAQFMRDLVSYADQPPAQLAEIAYHLPPPPAGDDADDEKKD